MSRPIHYVSRHDDADAFLPDPLGGPIPDDGGITSELVEDYLRAATTGQEYAEDIRNQEVTEEIGGPFVPSTAGIECADDIDDSNPIDARREPVPSPMRGRM
jgi:hypothetical protein